MLLFLLLTIGNSPKATRTKRTFLDRFGAKNDENIFFLMNCRYIAFRKSFSKSVSRVMMIFVGVPRKKILKKKPNFKKF